MKMKIHVFKTLLKIVKWECYQTNPKPVIFVTQATSSTSTQTNVPKSQIATKLTIVIVILPHPVSDATKITTSMEVPVPQWPRPKWTTVWFTNPPPNVKSVLMGPIYPTINALFSKILAIATF
jgi:hypothetical protein